MELFLLFSLFCVRFFTPFFFRVAYKYCFAHHASSFVGIRVVVTYAIITYSYMPMTTIADSRLSSSPHWCTPVESNPVPNPFGSDTLAESSSDLYPSGF